MKAFWKIAAAASTILAVVPASSETLDASDPERLARVIQELGYRARLDVDGVGDPLILSSAAGIDFAIYFFGCTDGEACSTLLFKAGFDLANGMTLEAVEAWNEEVLYGRVYLDDENDPWIELAVNLFGGVTRENFEDTFDWWETVLFQFQDSVDFNSSAPPSRQIGGEATASATPPGARRSS